ncbi:MAG: diguanylate cyclase [Actinobacteria bacterium]|nr:diguanylate cyclase [Actinomycetota bacterium]
MKPNARRGAAGRRGELHRAGGDRQVGHAVRARNGRPTRGGGRRLDHKKDGTDAPARFTHFVDFPDVPKPPPWTAMPEKVGSFGQTLADREQESSPSPAHAPEHPAAPVGRVGARSDGVSATRGGQETVVPRDQAAEERDARAERRDRLSMCRDEFAAAREERADELGAGGDPQGVDARQIQELRAHSRASRFRAKTDRAQAAHDRQQAARDRESAAHDRQRAGTDELTSTRRRGVGLEELDNEVKRARREGNSLVAAYVGVDGLKSINDEQGHAAGDRLLKTVAQGVRRHMRDYDLLVRLGGDEFLCVLPNVTRAQARRRFHDLRTELSKDPRGCSVSVGFSELREADSAGEFIRRADSDLLARRSGTPSQTSKRDRGRPNGPLRLAI